MSTAQNVTLSVSGIHCSSCASVISKKLGRVVGVKDCVVNAATETVNISFNPKSTSVSAMNSILAPLGYRLFHRSTDHPNLKSAKSRVLFVLSAAILVLVYMLWDIAASTLSFASRPIIPVQVVNWLLFLLSSVILFGFGQPFVSSLLKFVRYRVSNMDTLVGIGTLTAYIYSSVLLFLPSLAASLNLPSHTYFDVVIIVIGFVITGKYLESRSKQRTGQALSKLISLQAKNALVKKGRHFVEMPISQVKVGDIVLVKTASIIPVDGQVIDGSSTVNESMVTGESLPQDKKVSDFVIGSTQNIQGSLLVKATRVGGDTFLQKIIQLVSHAQDSKAPIQNLADRVASIFVPLVFVIAVSSLVIWLIVGFPVYALLSFVGVLVIACPCALGLATPTAIVVGVGKGAQNGILIKDSTSLEQLHRVDTLVFDKTGTITTGVPEVTDIIPISNTQTKKSLLLLAASLENHSSHPIATAIVNQAKTFQKHLPQAKNLIETQGVGVSGNISGTNYFVRKPTPKELSLPTVSELVSQGKTLVTVSQDDLLLGVIAVSDTLKPNAAKEISRLHSLGISTVMLTGDNRGAAEFIASKLKIDEVYSQVMPSEKAAIISRLQSQGKIVAMAGDGINDAPALTQADVGIAMATGTDIAIESADLVLLHGDISKIAQAITLSKKTLRTIKTNLFWAFAYNIVGLPLAAGAFYPFLGIFLNPAFAGLAMAFSSVSVVTNSLLLKRAKI